MQAGGAVPFFLCVLEVEANSEGAVPRVCAQQLVDSRVMLATCAICISITSTTLTTAVVSESPNGRFFFF